MSQLSNDALLRAADLAADTDPEGDGEAYWKAVRELHRRGTADICARALEWTQSESAARRGLGATILAQLGKAQGAPFRDESVPVLIAMLHDPVPLVVANAVFALGHLGAGRVDELGHLVHHPSDDVRWALAQSLSNLEDPAGLAVLITLSQDTDSGVRDWATFGLGTMSDADSPELREALLARLADDDAETRGEALVGLAKRGDMRALPAIERELQGESVGVLAIEAAEILAAPSCVPYLRELAACHPRRPVDPRSARTVRGSPWRTGVAVTRDGRGRVHSAGQVWESDVAPTDASSYEGKGARPTARHQPAIVDDNTA